MYMQLNSIICMYLTTHPGLLVAVVGHYTARIESFPKAARSFRFMNYNKLEAFSSCAVHC